MRQALQGHGKAAEFAAVVALSAGELQQLIAGEHQFTDQGHQIFKHINADADGLRGGVGGTGRSLRFRRGFGDRVLCDGGGRDDHGGGFGCNRYRGGNHGFGKDGLGNNGGCRNRRGSDRFGCGRGLTEADAVQRRNQGGIIADRLGFRGADAGDDFLDAVHTGQHLGDHVAGDLQFAVAHFAEDVFRRMGDLFQPGQAEEAASAFDGVHQPEDQRQHRLIARIALQLDQRAVEFGEALIGFGEKIRQQVVHCVLQRPLGSPSTPVRPCGAWAGDGRRVSAWWRKQMRKQ